jgi:hypothetical protein
VADPACIATTNRIEAVDAAAHLRPMCQADG